MKTQMTVFIIEDWIANTCFKGEEFPTFEDAEEFLCETLNDAYETGRQEYYIVPKGSK